jgi:predicted RNA-binding protein with PIN domain
MTVYLIDGYNVLHESLGPQRGEPRKGHARSAPAGRAGQSTQARAARAPAATLTGSLAAGESYLEDERRRLIDRIADYMGGSSGRAILVFDSHAQMLQKTESATVNVEVYFGSFSRSADSIIEREVYTLSAGEKVVVVSSDYQLQKTIFLPNVIRRSSRQFVSDLQEHTKRIANPQNCITMSHRIEERIAPGTVDRLKALRDELAHEPDEPDRQERGSDA